MMPDADVYAKLRGAARAFSDYMGGIEWPHTPESLGEDGWNKEASEHFAACSPQTILAILDERDQLRTALGFFLKASMFSSSPSRGESSIGWQQGDGTTANECMGMARAAIAHSTPKGA